jgi:hypothetical protein
MAKKPRKGKVAAPAAEGEAQPMYGAVMIPVQAAVSVGAVANFNELVIEWGCLGLSEEPDTLREVSGNATLFDPKRPPYIDADGLHLYFDPPITGNATYGFQFQFTYNEAAEARTAVPKTDEELAKEREAREATE